jgi:hypothetical protein
MLPSDRDDSDEDDGEGGEQQQQQQHVQACTNVMFKQRWLMASPPYYMHNICQGQLHMSV